MATLDFEHATIARIDQQLVDAAIPAQHFHFVEPAAVFVFQFNLQHLAAMLALDPFQDLAQWQDFPGHQRLAGDFMILAAVGLHR